MPFELRLTDREVVTASLRLIDKDPTLPSVEETNYNGYISITGTDEHGRGRKCMNSFNNVSFKYNYTSLKKRYI